MRSGGKKWLKPKKFDVKEERILMKEKKKRALYSEGREEGVRLVGAGKLVIVGGRRDLLALRGDFGLPPPTSCPSRNPAHATWP